MPTYIDYSQGQFGEADFPGSIRRATKRDGAGPPWIASAPGGKERRFRTPSSAWRWLRSLRQKPRGQPNTIKRLTWAYKSFPAPVFGEIVRWLDRLNSSVDQYILEGTPSTYVKRKWADQGAFSTTKEKAAMLYEGLARTMPPGSRSPLDRYIPWFAKHANTAFKGHLRVIKAQQAHPEDPYVDVGLSVSFLAISLPQSQRAVGAFRDWVHTRPNLQGTSPARAYQRALEWESGQLEERAYRKAKARLAKGGIGHPVMRAGGWTVREIGSRKTVPPWGSWETGTLKNPGRGGPRVDLEELTVVGRALGHCYQKGALQQSYATNIIKGRLGLLSVFSPDGMPVATMSVRINYEWPTWANRAQRAQQAGKVPRLSIDEFRGPRNQPVVASAPAMDKGVLALANKIFGTRFRSLARLLALLPDSQTGELFFGLIGQQEAWSRGPQTSASPFTQYLFAPVRKSIPSQDDFKRTPGSGWKDQPPAWSDIKQRSSGLEETLADPDWELENNYESLTTPTMRLIGAISDAQQKDRKPWDRNGFLVEVFTRKGRKSIVLIPEVAGGRLDDVYEWVLDSFIPWQKELARHRGEKPIVDQATDRVGPHPVQEAFFDAFEAASGQAYREVFGTYRKVKGKARLYKPGSSFLTLSWTGELSPSEARRFEYDLDSFLSNVDDDGPFHDYVELTKVLFDRRITPMLERLARRR